MARHEGFSEIMMKWSLTLGLVFLWLLPRVGICEISLSVDSTEVVSSNFKIDDLTLVRTHHDHNGDFIYVFKEGHRVWKSQKLMDSVAFGATQIKPQLIDLDGNGVNDILWLTPQNREQCDMLGIFMSFNRGDQNYYLSYRQDIKEDISDPGRYKFLLEVSKLAPTKEMWLKLGPILRKILGNNCNGKEIESIILNGNYQVNDPPATISKIENAHTYSVALYTTYIVTPEDIEKAKGYGEASPSPDPYLVRAALVLKPLYEVFYGLDYREVDPQNTNPRYTQILNDYGFLLAETGFNESAAKLIEYISQRDLTWKSIKPIAKPFERIVLPEHAKNPKYWVGKYYLEGDRETGAVLQLNDKGKFRFDLSTGAYDEYAKGNWLLNEEGYIILNSEGVVKPPRFVLKSSEKRLDNTLSIVVNRENGSGQQGIDVSVKFKSDPEIFGYTQSDGWKIPLSQAPQEIRLGISMYKIDPQLFKLDRNTHNYFVFEFQPGNIGEVRLDDFHLRTENNALVVEKKGNRTRFVKR